MTQVLWIWWIVNIVKEIEGLESVGEQPLTDIFGLIDQKIIDIDIFFKKCASNNNDDEREI